VNCHGQGNLGHACAAVCEENGAEVDLLKKKLLFLYSLVKTE
jgi:glycerol-3-phosphate dehydrogenase